MSLSCFLLHVKYKPLTTIARRKIYILTCTSFKYFFLTRSCFYCYQANHSFFLIKLRTLCIDLVLSSSVLIVYLYFLFFPLFFGEVGAIRFIYFLFLVYSRSCGKLCRTK